MKNYFKIIKNNDDVVVYNLDKFVGKFLFAMTITGIITTTKAVKKLIKRKGELKYEK